MSQPALKRVDSLSEADLTAALRGRRVLILGGTAGLGAALASAALKRGADVTIVGRRQPPGELAGANFISKDLSSMHNAVQLANEMHAAGLLPHTIVFSNGIVASPTPQRTEEGVELDLAVSYLSRFAFIRRLTELGFGTAAPGVRVNTPKPRVFILGYPGVKNEAQLDDFNSENFAKYDGMTTHYNTVVGNEALVGDLQTRFGARVNVYGLNPGWITTEIRKNFFNGSFIGRMVEAFIRCMYMSADQYAERHLIHVLVSPQLEARPAVLIGQQREILRPNPWLAEDSTRAKRIIRESEKVLEKALARAHN